MDSRTTPQRPRSAPPPLKFDSAPSGVPLTASPVNVQSFSVLDNRVLGVLLEGSVTLNQECEMRTWFESGTGASPWGGYPVAVSECTHGHIRGWYQSCKAVIEGLTFEATPPAPPEQAWAKSASGSVRFGGPAGEVRPGSNLARPLISLWQESRKRTSPEAPRACTEGSRRQCSSTWLDTGPFIQISVVTRRRVGG